ncbi:MAG: polysaccharide deacetylase family protein [Clostridia bacterium]|nr:polysaccharide deacetylase family protein [Clostridia bacterium]
MYLTIRLHRGWLSVLALAAAVLITALRWTPSAATTATAPDGVAVPIIMYHSVLPDRQGTYIVHPDRLEQDLVYLRDNGYTTVTVADLIAYVDDGKPLPDKPIMLTFDDGYYNNYLYAHPLLKKHGMRAVISPIGSVSEFYSDHPAEQDKPRYSHVTWAQLTDMVQSGVWEIQHHSYDMHKTDVRKGVAQKKGERDSDYRTALTRDLQKATALLKEQTGATPTAFVYPFGAYTKLTDPILREGDIRATITCEERTSVVTRNPDSLWRLGRYLRKPDMDSKTYFDTILS